MKKLFEEFKAFIAKGNVLDMAIGVIIATAFGKITSNSEVCFWCRAEERKPPRRLEDLPFDHMHGRCGIEPANERATAEYNYIVYGDVNGRND